MEAAPRSHAVLRFPSSEGDSSTATRVSPFSPAASVPRAESVAPAYIVRMAVYGSHHLPDVYDVQASDPGALLAEMCRRTLSAADEIHAAFPAEALVAVVENLIHARFHLAVISVSENAVRVSDQGPGIPDKARAMLPGFTTATAEMRRYIRGVGSGLDTARRLMESLGGQLLIEDNLSGGTVATLTREPATIPGPAPQPSWASPRFPFPPGTARLADGPPMGLSGRQRRILSLLGDAGEVGPSAVSQHLGYSLTTAFRELVALEGAGLVVADGSGKRRLTAAGMQRLDSLVREEMGSL